jgi:DNA repair exonuclease SbcCD ATPase subunit
MTASANMTRGGRQKAWTRDKIIERIQRWVTLYGEPPRSADWNPSAAKWSASEWRVERYRLGDPETGAPWPSLNATKREFGGSLSAAIIAAGFEPNKPGPKARKDVRPEVTARQPIPTDVRIAMEGLGSDIRRLERKLATRERQLERARSATAAARSERDAARRARAKTNTVVRTRTKTKTKTVRDGRAEVRLKAALARERDLKAEKRTLVAEVREARLTAARLAARLERAEATITDLRQDRRELRTDLERVTDTADRLKANVRPRAPETVVKVEKETVYLPAPEQEEIDAARAEAERAAEAVRAAKAAQATAERRYMEIAEAATGDRRILSEGELVELRRGGPSGPAVLGAALTGLAKARKVGGKGPLRSALYEVASAAVRWRDRL